jgi:hypothetical protein
MTPATKNVHRALIKMNSPTSAFTSVALLMSMPLIGNDKADKLIAMMAFRRLVFGF